MKNLISVELYKILRGKDKYILVCSFLLMFLLSWTNISHAIDSNINSFFYNFSSFFKINFDLLFPLSIGIFTISSICNEYTNNAIKNYLMSGYSKEKIVFSKLISIFLSVIFIFLITIVIFLYLSYSLSDKSPIYINFKITSFKLIILNIASVILMILFYIFAIVSFSLMLGYLTRRKGLSILIYIILITVISVLYGGLKNLLTIPCYTFFQTSNVYNYIGIYGFGFNKIMDIIPSLSNSSLFLATAIFAFNKYEY